VEDEKKEFKRDSAMILDTYALQKFIVKSLLSKTTQVTTIKNYTKEQVEEFLDNPQKNEKQLREISNALYHRVSQYKRTVNYFAKLLTFAYNIEPYGLDIGKQNIDKVKKQYIKISEFIELMNLKHEFQKICLVAFREDVFYGYEHMSDDSYFIQRLNSDYCQITSIEDGVYNFAFDFSYFDRDKDKLLIYPPEFESKYNIYKKDMNQKWQELESKNTICIKVNEDIDYVVPPLAGTFASLYDIEDYKKLKKANGQIGSYKLLVQHIPMKKDSDKLNDFLIDFDTVMSFHNRSAESLPEEISMITTPMNLEAIDFAKNMESHEYVAEAETSYWNGTGISQLLFGTEKSSSVGLTNSIKTDEQLAFGVLRQLERWVNRRLKFEYKAFKFRVNMLNITIFNQQEFFENALKSAEFGLPTKSIICSSLGISPVSISNLAFLENEVLGLNEKLIPLKSSHTGQGGDNPQNGKPTISDKKISDEGLKTRDGEKNKK
jgi:hypothetical protein